MFTLMRMSDGVESARPQVELEWGYAMMLNGSGLGLGVGLVCILDYKILFKLLTPAWVVGKRFQIMISYTFISIMILCKAR